MKVKDKIQLKIHFIPELATSIIYISITLLMLCLCIIISCEVQKVTLSAIICGLLFVILASLMIRNQLYVKDNGIWCRCLLKRSYGFYFKDIDDIFITNRKLVIEATHRQFVGYISKKHAEVLRRCLESNGIKMKEEQTKK